MKEKGGVSTTAEKILKGVEPGTALFDGVSGTMIPTSHLIAMASAWLALEHTHDETPSEEGGMIEEEFNDIIEQIRSFCKDDHPHTDGAGHDCNNIISYLRQNRQARANYYRPLKTPSEGTETQGKGV